MTFFDQTSFSARIDPQESNAEVTAEIGNTPETKVEIRRKYFLLFPGQLSPNSILTSPLSFPARGKY